MKQTLEFLPILAFFISYQLWGLMPATAILVALTLVSAGYLYASTRTLPFGMLVTAAIVALFGGLTLWLNDERFIKMKPTIVSLIFAGVLAVGLLRGKALLRHVFGAAMELPDAAWRTLSRNYALFFALMAGLNEIIWRSFSTDIWVNFKLFGMMGLSLAFSAWQLAPHIKRIAQEEEAS